MNLKNITKEPFELPSEILSHLERNSQMIFFRKNDTIVTPGSTDSPWFFISAGLARLFIPSGDTEFPDKTVLFGEAGNIATSVSNFMLGLPAVMGIQAVTPVKAYKIPAEIIKELYASNLTFCRWLMELAMLQIAHLEIRSTYFLTQDPYERFISFMRFKPKSYIRRVPGYMLASYLSLTRTEYFEAKEKYERECLTVQYDKEFLDKVGLTGYAPEE